MDRQELLHLLGAEGKGPPWKVRCPAHKDDNPSLSILVGDNGWLHLKCHAGCTEEAIREAKGIPNSALAPDGWNGKAKKPEIVATYEYLDETRKPLHQTVRYEPKDFKQRRYNGAGGWTWGLGDVRMVVYHLPDLCEDAEIFWVEGEKDADALRALGLGASTACCGAKGWKPDYALQLLQSRIEEVVILPDLDKPGRAYARQVARGCLLEGLRVKIVELPFLEGQKGKDVSDWLFWGHTVEELVTLAEKARLETTESVAEEAEEPKKFFLNAHLSVKERQASPRPRWLIPGILPEKSLVCIYGKPGCGKTFLAVSLAGAVASGEPWMGEKLKQGQVVYLPGEGSIPLRIRGYVEGEPPPAREGLWGRLEGQLIEFSGVPLLLKPAHVSNFLEQIVELKLKPKLIVVDTLALAILGGEENSSDSMGEAIHAMKEILTLTGATVLAIHHTGKDEDRGARGSSALLGAVDTMISVELSGRNFTIKCEKQREFEAFKTIALVFEETPFGMDEDGLPISSRYLRRQRAVERSMQLAENDRRILELLSKPENSAEGLTATDIKSNLDLPHSTWKEARKRLIDKDLIVERKKRYFVTHNARPETKLQEDDSF